MTLYKIVMKNYVLWFLVAMTSLDQISSQQPLGLFGFEPYQIYEMPSYSSYGRKMPRDDFPPVRRHAKMDSSPDYFDGGSYEDQSQEQFMESMTSEVRSVYQNPKELKENSKELKDNSRELKDNSKELKDNSKETTGKKKPIGKEFLELIETSKVKSPSERRRLLNGVRGKPKSKRRMVSRNGRIIDSRNGRIIDSINRRIIDSRIGRIIDSREPEDTTGIIDSNELKFLTTVPIPNFKNGQNSGKFTIENQSRENVKTQKRYRKPMSLDKLAVEQFNRVMKTAEKLNILDKNVNERGLKDQVKEMTLATPKGTYEEGSIVKLKLMSQGPNFSGFTMDVRRGPYENAYHTQILNDYDKVLAMLGSSADAKVTPDIPSILDKIMLKSDWEIHRL